MLRSGTCGASMTDAETFSKAKPPPTDDSPPFDPPSNSPPTDFVSSFDATATSDNQIFRSALRDSSSSVDWLGREMFEMRPRERLVMWRPRDKVDHDDDDDKPLFLEESGVAQLVDIIKVVLLPLLSFIGKVTTSSTLPLSQEASNFDEVYVQQSLLFDDSLRDLKNLRTQLYSAAEYFELSYTNDDQKQIVVETLKDYAIKALANTVDHLGTVTYRVNDLLDEKVVEVSGVEQSLVISTPKYHKLYVLPVGETMIGANLTKLKYVGCSLEDEEEWPHFRNVVRATIRETPISTTTGKGRSPSPSVQPQRPGPFSFTLTMPKKDLEKRSVSPYRFPLLHSGSRSSRPTTPKMSRSTTPNPSRPITPNPSNAARQRYPSEPCKSASI